MVGAPRSRRAVLPAMKGLGYGGSDRNGGARSARETRTKSNFGIPATMSAGPPLADG